MIPNLEIMRFKFRPTFVFVLLNLVYSFLLIYLFTSIIHAKIVSSSIISSSSLDENQDSKRHRLQVYYCLCSEFLLVINFDLRQLPRRKTDNAIIVDNTKRTYKLTANSNGPVIIKRPDGFEKQYRYHCPRCELLIAYEMQEERKSDTYTYIVDGSLTETQGNIPPTSLLEPTT
ncbi:unnamed protein product [Cunninghamella blakesleeana]